jgi:hypothetical protein
MPDIAFIGDRSFLYEKLFKEIGADYQFLMPSVLGSPFLPRFKMLMIPTGFANPQYSESLQALKAASSRIAEFVKAGGVLTVFGPLSTEHSYEWLPLELKYVCEYGAQDVADEGCACQYQGCACMSCTLTPECDGYLIPGEGFETVLKDSKGRAVLAVGKYGQGLIIVTSIHEFPSTEYLRWGLAQAKQSRI